MSLLSKLFGGAANEAKKQAQNALKQAEQLRTAGGAQMRHASSGQRTRSTQASVDPSYWDTMPDEECQYSYPGPYADYFEHLFREEFPNYSLDKQVRVNSAGNERTIFSFFSGERKALVVELMTERSSATSIRTQCAKAGIPYLRFYYDHRGWWNTRSYVTGRVRAALGL